VDFVTPSPDAKLVLLYNSYRDKEVCDIHTQNIKFYLRHNLFGENCQAVAWSPDSQTLAVALDNKLVFCHIYHAKITTLEMTCTALAWGKSLAMGLPNGQIGLYDFTKITYLTGHQDTIVSLAWHPDHIHLVSCSADHTMRIWHTH
jgi:WD40 repeat protein